jgi:hypothetical protein
MKKVFIFGLSVALVAGSVTSCKKTSKGKLSNDWKTTSWNSTETETDANESTVTTVTSTDGVAITVVSTTTPTGGTAGTPNTINGVINDMSYTISKDGTFENNQDVTFTSTFTGGSVVSNTVTKTTGTWNFLSSNKTEEFKKNERVVFHILSEKTTDTQTITTGGSAGTPSVSSSDNTYATGENSDIFTVVESKGKLLTLMSETNSKETNTSGGSSSTETVVSSLEFTLEQK